jgi:hypothetical protein
VYQTLEIKAKNSGRGLSGYTVNIYNWSSVAAGYSGTALYTLTDNSDGVYYFDCSETFKGTVVVTHASYSSFTLTPTHLKGTQWHGENMAELPPPVSS